MEKSTSIWSNIAFVFFITVIACSCSNPKDIDASPEHFELEKSGSLIAQPENMPPEEPTKGPFFIHKKITRKTKTGIINRF